MQKEQKRVKRGREEDSVPLRSGILWRKETGKWMVEVRLPNTANWKLHLGSSYDSKYEAMVARDYATFLRISVEGDAVKAGGVDNQHPSLYEFSESSVIFASLPGIVRCENYREIYEQLKSKVKGDKTDTNPSFKEFCENARKDIKYAIGELRKSYPEKFNSNRTTEPLVDENHNDSSSSNPGGRVLLGQTPAPTNGAIRGDGTADINSSDGVLLRIEVNVGGLSRGQAHGVRGVLSIEEYAKILLDTFLSALDLIRNAETERLEVLEAMEAMSPCTVDPSDYPVIEEKEEVFENGLTSCALEENPPRL